MLSEMVGPWRRTEYDSFVRLDTELKPAKPVYQTLSGLMSPLSVAAAAASASAEVARQDEADRVDKAWSVRRMHPIYLWLKSRPEFDTLWRLFEKMRAQAKTDATIQAANAPFVLLRIIVEYVGVIFDVRQVERRGVIPYGPSTSRRRAAIGHVDALVKLSNEGVNLRGIEGAQLRNLLNRFGEQLRNVKRKPRGGKGSSIRRVLELTAFELVASLRLSSPSILANVAALADHVCDEKTAQRYFRHAESKYSELLKGKHVDQAGHKMPPN
jgi:hypothetical protein